MAKSLAKKLNYIYVDTGAMYRAVTLYALRAGLMDADTKAIDTEGLKAQLDKVNITFTYNEEGRMQTVLNGEIVEKEIREMTVSNCVSPISALSFVREYLVALQQKMGLEGGIVMDGRDIGTVVFPNADLKVFVTASAEVRAQRRLLELQGKGDREVSPLRKADDALLLDNSNLTIPEQDELLLKWAMDCINA